jgi:hypothetical protein
MAYVECKIWHFQGDDDYSQKSRYKAMKEGHVHHTVKTSSENFISENLANRLGKNYTKHHAKEIPAKYCILKE